MNWNTPPVILSVKSFIRTEIIDGGDAVAVWFEAPDSREIVVIIPQQPAAALQSHLYDELDLARDCRSTRRI